MRIHKDYYLFLRTLPSGRKVWYYRIYRDDGARSVPRSTGVEYTGKVSRIRAEKVCNELMVSGRLDGIASMKFATYSVGWFEEGRCQWLADRHASGIPGRPGISPAYIAQEKLYSILAK